MSDVVLNNVIDERKNSILVNKNDSQHRIQCETDSVAGSISQRACVYCGARVVLNPITDAFHIVHGPIGCASYTWDIRGSLSSGSEIYRNSFSTDIQEKEVIFGGEIKLSRAIDEILANNNDNPPKVIFVYATCIVGVIGDDIKAVCKNAEKKHGIRVIPVESPGFAGNKSIGYKAACHALLDLMGSPNTSDRLEGVNFLGDYNLAGEMWIIKRYLKNLGIPVVAGFTGDAKCEDLINAPRASFNIVQCAGSMTYLAKQMQKRYGIPFINISFFGMEDIKESLINIAKMTNNKDIVKRADSFSERMQEKVTQILFKYRKQLQGKRAAIYVGGGFKAISLIKQFKNIGMKVVLVGTQTGKKEEYERIKELTDKGTIILDDTNPYELEKFILKKKADILVGGVKERPLAYKLGIGFCDHNHERKHPLAGYEGIINFAREISQSVNSPVWKIVKEHPVLH